MHVRCTTVVILYCHGPVKKVQIVLYNQYGMSIHPVVHLCITNHYHCFKTESIGQTNSVLSTLNMCGVLVNAKVCECHVSEQRVCI